MGFELRVHFVKLDQDQFVFRIMLLNKIGFFNMEPVTDRLDLIHARHFLSSTPVSDGGSGNTEMLRKIRLTFLVSIKLVI